MEYHIHICGARPSLSRPGTARRWSLVVAADLPALFDLTGQTAVVAGGGGALGAVVAEGLAAAGASVVVVDLRQPVAERASQAIATAGGRAVGLAADLSSEAEVARVFAEVDAT